MVITLAPREQPISRTSGIDLIPAPEMIGKAKVRWREELGPYWG